MLILNKIHKNRIVIYLSILFLMLFNSLSAGDDSEYQLVGYVSPGINLGYTFDEGFTYGLQLTSGFFLEDVMSIAGSAGVTIGFQKSEHRKTKYIDLQISPFGLVGIGIGLATNINQSDLSPNSYLHFKTWGGIFGLLQYDSFKSNSDIIHYVGFSGVAPLTPFRHI